MPIRSIPFKYGNAAPDYGARCWSETTCGQLGLGEDNLLRLHI